MVSAIGEKHSNIRELGVTWGELQCKIGWSRQASSKGDIWVKIGKIFEDVSKVDSSRGMFLGAEAQMGSMHDILTSSKEANETGTQLVQREEKQRERKPQRWQGDRAQTMRAPSISRTLTFILSKRGKPLHREWTWATFVFYNRHSCALLRKDCEGVRDGRKQRNQLGICWNNRDKKCQWLGHKRHQGRWWQLVAYWILFRRQSLQEFLTVAGYGMWQREIQVSWQWFWSEHLKGTKFPSIEREDLCEGLRSICWWRLRGKWRIQLWASKFKIQLTSK